ncbi:glycosyl hydrolase [Actinoplanes sp. NPDC051475]|uniref:glycoside hydrolase family 26 protein n=1 Tax=Actinoplanes sp. NPDC051475 TaxID=3157225 RepID=UPI00344BBBDC
MAIATMTAGVSLGSTSPAAAEGDGYKVPSRSGAAWASGVFVLGYDLPRFAAFGDYRQRPLDVVSTFPPRANWDDFIQPGPAYSTFTGQPYTVVFGMPAIPEVEDASMAQCAAGEYHDKWTTFGHTLTDAGLGSSIIRLGWEMNGSWFRWGGDKAHPEDAPRHALEYKNCFRQVVTAVHEVAPDLKFDWNVNRGQSDGIPDTSDLQNVAYPGDAYVDIIGVDTYDSWVDWNWAINDPEQGLNAWLTFAKKHGKKLSVPEWGLYTTTFDDGTPAPGHGDQPGYIQHMYDFFKDNAADIAYEAYFSNPGNDGRNSLSDPVQMPMSSAKYQELYKKPSLVTTSIQDTARGSGDGQVQFSAGWGQCTTTCGRASDGSYVWTATPGSTATVRFTGSRLRWFGMKEPFSVIATVAIDGRAAVDVDPYAATASASSQQLYVSPTLSQGAHTAVITMTNRRNPASTGGSSITFDRADVD